MRWLTHQAAGLLVAEAVLRRTHPGLGVGAGCVAAALAGSVAPDLDHLGAIFRRSFPGSGLGHRTFTHGLAGLAAAAWLGGMIHLPLPAELGWVGGWAAHLLADCLSPAGCPLLWPLRGRTALPLVRTGGPLETWLVRPALLLAAAAGLLSALR